MTEKQLDSGKNLNIDGIEFSQGHGENVSCFDPST